MNPEEKLLLAKAEDAMALAEKNYKVKSVGFLNPFERRFLEKNLLPNMGISLNFDGGYPDAERTLAVCMPEELNPMAEEYIAVLECTGRRAEELTHRDYLGSLMALGVTRDSIGDIVVESDRAYLFVKSETVVYLMQNLTKIGGVGIQLRQVKREEVSVSPPSVQEIRTTVSSMRLDSVLAAAISTSRAKAAEMIRAGLVAVNWEVKEDVSASVREQDLLSVRGFGRYKIAVNGGITGKGRCRIVLWRYH